MKTKTIEKVIQNKISDWIGSIDDTDLILQLQNNVIVTGGCIASMLLQEDVNDYDIYFKDKKTTLAVANYYANKFNLEHDYDIEVKEKDDIVGMFIQSSGVAGTMEFDEAEDSPIITPVVEGYKATFISQNAITLSNKIQLIVRFYGNPTEIHKNFDFVHCTNYWDSETGKLTLNTEALASILTKELRYVGSLYPFASIVRTRKFIKRQWSLNAGQYLKMAFQLNSMDLSDINVLKEQLVGVDLSHFSSVIWHLSQGENEKIDAAYITAIIDKIF